MSEQRRVEETKAAPNHTNLKVYQLAFDSAMQIFEISKRWPVEERYSLTDQIRRSSRSVCANLTEAWRKRRYPAHFASKLSDADTEAAETAVWLNFAHRCQYIDAQTFKTLNDHYDHICRMLTKMITNPDSWILKS